MSDLRVAAAQFESRNGDKDFNLERINDLSARAAAAGADVMAFHECSITGYSFARRLSKAELLEIAEQVPGGPTVERLIRISRKSEIVILAGLFERGDDGEIYKAQVCVDGTGVLASFRKLHPFINPAIKPGNGYVVFDLRGWKCGILICYDKWWRT
jgi:predicted amidohydrolase